MGGFAFETSTPLLGKRTRFTITEKGMKFLMEHAPELIPDISEASILDRSQSDSLGKALLIAQLLYFCISCTARWAQSLPLSLLEVSTLAHAICAVVTYFVWWKKPFDVAEPTVIYGPYADEVAAFLLLFSDACKGRGIGYMMSWCYGEHRYLTISRTTESDDSDSSEAVVIADEALQALDLRARQKVQVGDSIFSLTDQSLDSTRYTVYGGDSLPWFQRNRGPDDGVCLDKEDLTRWRLAERAMTRFSNRPFGVMTRALVSWHSNLQYSLQSPESDNDIGWLCLLLLIAALYGSCHLLGWDSTFPTSVERIMWRAGGLTMVFMSIYPFIATLFGSLLEDLISVLVPNADVNFTVIALFKIPIVVYSVTSAFLIVESTRQLFYLPDSAFKLPDFSVYLPHIA